MPLLNPGDPFPRLTISTADGQTLTIPDAFAGDFAVVLFYRGAWCPYCNAQLRAFERAGQALADNGHPRRRPLGGRQGDHRRAGRQAQADLPRRLRRGRAAPSPRSPAPSSTPTRCTCSPPASCSTRRGTSSSACTQAAPSGGSSPTTSSAWSATCASTRRRRRRDADTGDGSMTGCGYPLLLRPGVPVRVDDEQVGAHGRRAAGLHRRLAVHLAPPDQLRESTTTATSPPATRKGTPPGCGCCGSPRGSGPSTGGPPSARSTRPSAARSSTLPVPPG